MACIHCALVQGNLPALVIPALLGRHLAIGLGLASEGIVLGKCSGWFLCGMGEPGKPTSLVNTVIFNWYSFRMMFFCQWNSFKPWVAGLLLLSTATVQFSFRRFKLCADILPIYSRVIDINNFCLYWFGVWVVGTLDIHLAWSQVWDFIPTICC